MKKSLHMLVLISWLSTQTVLMACLNMYGTTIHGHARTSSDFPIANRLQNVSANRTQWEIKEADLAKGLENADFQHRSDYAVALLHLERVPEAIELLEAIEQEHPGEYIVAANLGTAYELNGENEKALEWIKKGIELNSDSHYGTEWLHVRILETKLKLAEDPDWLKTHSVLGLDFGTDPKPVTPQIEFVDPAGKRLELYQIVSALDYQLGERLQFVSSPEPIVGDLLFDLANLTALTEVIEHAIPVYEMAEKYGVRDPELLKRRVDYFQKLVAANPQSGKQAGGGALYEGPVLAVLGVMVVGGLLVLAIVIALIVKWVRHRKQQAGWEP